MRSRLAILASCAISVCLAASPVASATERWETVGSFAAGSTTAEFDVAGSNGYRAYFNLSPGTATVDAVQAPTLGTFLSVTYISDGSLEGDRVRARFGSRGRVAVEFRPSGEVKRRLPPRRCEGEPRVTRHGVFVGTIRLQGEAGFTTVDATRARGRLRTIPRWRCKRGRGSARTRVSSASSTSIRGPLQLGLDPEAERFTVLDAESDEGNTSFTVRAVRLRGRSGSTTFIATRSERRPNLRIVRFAIADGADETFGFDEALSTASVSEPPAPFAGAAAFARDAGGKVCVRHPCDRSSWLGPLTVDFPGAENVPLAGEPFRARLYREGLDGSILR